VQANTIKYKQLRAKYVWFAYEDFSWEETSNELKVRYHFNLSDQFHFYPRLVFLKKDFTKWPVDKSILDNLVFHLGMIELISYWKTTCSPDLIIKPFYLDEKQIAWWKKLYFHGLGEFFYLNGIEADRDDFIDIKVESEKKLKSFENSLNDKVLVPIGGGKDSVVTLELLKDQFEVAPFILNLRSASLQTTNVAGFPKDEVVLVKRFLDKKLLELNDKGFLNGHTPFSAMLAFVSLISATLGGFKHIALSNEASANEATEMESGVNHQYSKSLEFEEDFRWYVKKYISQELNYFSFLRPLSELQIAKLFSGFPKYFPVFKSCNVGSKTDSWCGACPKCLFVNIILSPFISSEQRIAVFGKDLFEDMHLRGYLDELTGISDVKPFECVGTLDEVNLALSATINNYGDKKLPSLLDYYIEQKPFRNYQDVDFGNELIKLENDHCLSGDFMKILKQKLLEG
jgi:hypothetical protein